MFLDPQELMTALLPAVWSTDEGVICIDYGERPRVSLESAQRAYHRHLHLAPSRRSPVLVLCAGQLQLEPAALRFAHAEAVRAITAAVGIVTPARLARHFGNLHLAYARPPYPTRRFATSEQALQWLRGHLPGDQATANAEPGSG